MFGKQNVSASEVLNTRDLSVRPGRDLTEIVGTFLTVAEAVVAHWGSIRKGFCCLSWSLATSGLGSSIYMTGERAASGC